MDLKCTTYSRIQELTADDQKEAGRIPRTIECELVQDLVDSCVPGDVITITGIVKVSNTEEGMLYLAVVLADLYLCRYSSIFSVLKCTENKTGDLLKDFCLKTITVILLCVYGCGPGEQMILVRSAVVWSLMCTFLV